MVHSQSTSAFATHVVLGLIVLEHDLPASVAPFVTARFHTKILYQRSKCTRPWMVVSLRIPSTFLPSN